MPPYRSTKFIAEVLTLSPAGQPQAVSIQRLALEAAAIHLQIRTSARQLVTVRIRFKNAWLACQSAALTLVCIATIFLMQSVKAKLVDRKIPRTSDHGGARASGALEDRITVQHRVLASCKLIEHKSR